MTSQALARVETSRTAAITDRAAQLRAKGRDIISLSVGEPDFAMPDHIASAAKRAVDAGDTRYTPVAGTPALRKAAARHFERDLGITTQADQVLVSSGGKQAIFDAILATVSSGDQVIVPSPWWVSYPQIIRFAGGKVIPLVTQPHKNYRFSPGDLESLIGPSTRWLLLNSPNNPTGTVYPAEMLEGLAQVLRYYPQVMVMSDDIYAPLNYTDTAHASIAGVAPDLADRVLTISGVSKSHAMTGLRIGFAAGPKWLIDAMERLQSHNSGCANSLAQAAAEAALDGPQGFLDDWCKTLTRRRDMVVSAINAIPGLSCAPPDGAFYCYVDASELMPRFGNDEALALHLLENGVAVVPASAFGGKRGLRISFATGQDQLEQAIERIRTALKQ